MTQPTRDELARRVERLEEELDTLRQRLTDVERAPPPAPPAAPVIYRIEAPAQRPWWAPPGIMGGPSVDGD